MFFRVETKEWMMMMERTKQARLARLKVGENTEEQIYRKINKEKKTTAYRLMKELDWTPGRTHSAINRLEEKGLVSCKEEIVNGRAQKILAPIGCKHLLK
jgi:DNA-binding MarR family transcriptional regulator